MGLVSRRWDPSRDLSRTLVLLKKSFEESLLSEGFELPNMLTSTLGTVTISVLSKLLGRRVVLMSLVDETRGSSELVAVLAAERRGQALWALRSFAVEQEVKRTLDLAISLRSLLRCCIERCRILGAREVVAEVRKGNDAIRTALRAEGFFLTNRLRLVYSRIDGAHQGEDASSEEAAVFYESVDDARSGSYGQCRVSASSGAETTVDLIRNFFLSRRLVGRLEIQMGLHPEPSSAVVAIYESFKRRTGLLKVDVGENLREDLIVAAVRRGMGGFRTPPRLCFVHLVARGARGTGKPRDDFELEGFAKEAVFYEMARLLA